jgi:DNA-binding response OmpR family regulator
MNTPARSDVEILVIDDDSFFIEYLSGVLSDFKVTSSLTAELIDEATIKRCALVILDIDLGSENGFDVCEKVRQHCEITPILFISGMHDLDTRLKAYGCGGNDYVAKPFLAGELIEKTKSLIAGYQRIQALDNSLEERSALVFDIQREAYNLKIVNQFTLHSSQCKELDQLYILFFHALTELGTSGVLEIGGENTRSSDGNINNLEAEILSMADKLSRIYSFGNGRALYNWSNCRLLLRKVGNTIDTTAFLMDALEININRIQQEQALFSKTQEIEHHNAQSQAVISGLINEMTESITDEVLTLGIVSSLAPEEEQKLQALIATHHQRLNQQLAEQLALNEKLKNIIKQIRSTSPQFHSYIESIQQSDAEDSVELF